MKTLILKSLSLATLLSASTAFAQTIIQTHVAGSNGLSANLPTDGSNCDPRIIAKNLKILAKADVLNATNLTETIPANGNCYGPCETQIQEALEQHCAKADKLAEIADLLK